MVELISPPPQTLLKSQPRQTPQGVVLEIAPASSAQSIPLSASGRRSGHLNLATFSPVNQNGSFEFDRVLKSGQVLKRTRKTKVREELKMVCLALTVLIQCTCSNGRSSTWFCGQTCYPCTRPSRKSDCTSKSACPILQRSRISRTLKVDGSMFLGYSRPRGTITYKQKMRKMLEHG